MGHQGCLLSGCLLWVIIADIGERIRDDRFVPIADIRSLRLRRDIFLTELFLVPLCPQRHSVLGEKRYNGVWKRQGNNKDGGFRCVSS
jgi:hypothetical protein